MQLSFFPDQQPAEPVPRQRKPSAQESQERLLDSMVDGLLLQCQSEDIDPRALLMQLQLRHLWDEYLSRLSHREQMVLAAQLLELIHKHDPDNQTEKSS
jgi:hypothetical protein